MIDIAHGGVRRTLRWPKGIVLLRAERLGKPYKFTAFEEVGQVANMWVILRCGKEGAGEGEADPQ